MKITMLIKNLYEQQQAGVRATYGLTKRYSIGEGVRQGCILSPHRFNIYTEAIMKEAIDEFEGTVKIGGRAVYNLSYADDVVLISGSIQELQGLVSRTTLKSEEVGLYLNVEKTKVMKIETDSPNNENLVEKQMKRSIILPTWEQR